MDSGPAKLLLIGGVRKSGTSSLFHTLAEHPGVDVPRMKEPQFLALHPEVVSAHLSWYLGLFEDRRPGNLLLDGSTWCFASPWTVQVLREHFPDARVILVLRDPVRRAFSGYLHMLKMVPAAETRSFEEILGGLEAQAGSCSLAEAENRLLCRAIGQGRVNVKHSDESFHREKFGAPFPTRLHDGVSDYKYFQESCYSSTLPAFERELGESLEVVLFERLMAEPGAVLKELLDFAGLSSDSFALELRHENPTLVPRSRLSRAAMEARARYPVLDRVAALLKGLGLESAGRRFRERFLLRANPRIGRAHYERARALLAPEYDYWAQRRPETVALWKP